MNGIDLAGRSAVVTGGARGIGYACAERILACGGRVCLWDRDAAALERAAANARARAPSRSTWPRTRRCAAAAQATGSRIGRVDILDQQCRHHRAEQDHVGIPAGRNGAM